MFGKAGSKWGGAACARSAVAKSLGSHDDILSAEVTLCDAMRSWSGNKVSRLSFLSLGLAG